MILNYTRYIWLFLILYLIILLSLTVLQPFKSSSRCLSLSSLHPFPSACSAPKSYTFPDLPAEVGENLGQLFVPGAALGLAGGDGVWPIQASPIPPMGPGGVAGDCTAKPVPHIKAVLLLF